VAAKLANVLSVLPDFVCTYCAKQVNFQGHSHGL